MPYSYPYPRYGSQPLYPAGYQVYGRYPVPYGSNHQQISVSGHSQAYQFFPWYGSIQAGSAYWPNSPAGFTGWSSGVPVR